MHFDIQCFYFFGLTYRREPTVRRPKETSHIVPPSLASHNGTCLAATVRDVRLMDRTGKTYCRFGDKMVGGEDL